MAMPVLVHQLTEVPVADRSLSREDVLGFLKASAPDIDVNAEDVDKIASAFNDEATVGGTYRFYNPSICTLPPEYVEPGIKLTGTMAVLHGKAAYECLKNAVHCALFAAAGGSDEELKHLSAFSKQFPRGEEIFQACSEILADRALDAVCNAIETEAKETDLVRTSPVIPGTQDCPLDTNTQILFYTHATEKLGITCEKSGELHPSQAVLGIIGIQTPDNKPKRRACGRCRYVRHCNIRAIGMTCHGRKGSFDWESHS